MRNCFGNFSTCIEPTCCPTVDECRYCTSVLDSRARAVIDLERLKREGVVDHISQYGDLNDKEEDDMSVCVKKDCPARAGDKCFGPYLFDGKEENKTICIRHIAACKWPDKVLKKVKI